MPQYSLRTCWCHNVSITSISVNVAQFSRKERSILRCPLFRHLKYTRKLRMYTIRLCDRVLFWPGIGDKLFFLANGFWLEENGTNGNIYYVFSIFRGRCSTGSYVRWLIVPSRSVSINFMWTTGTLGGGQKPEMKQQLNYNQSFTKMLMTDFMLSFDLWQAERRGKEKQSHGNCKYENTVNVGCLVAGLWKIWRKSIFVWMTKNS